MLGADDLGGVAVERGQLAPLVAPGLVQEVVADHARGLGEGPGDPPEHEQVPRSHPVGVGEEVIERPVRRGVGGHPHGPVLAPGGVVGVRGGSPRRDGPPREAGARPARRVPRESVLVDIDDHVDSPGPGLGRDRLELGEVGIVVDPGNRLVGFPDEEHPDDVEAQLGHAVEVGRAGAGKERGHLGIARQVHPAEDHHPALSVHEMPSPRCRSRGMAAA